MGRSVVEVLEYTNSAASCRRRQQDGAADDDGRLRGLRLRSRSGQGWRRRRLQQVSHSDQGWPRRLPSGTSTAMSARERLEARRRIEWLLDEDRRRVAPPPEKATMPVGWLDHERRCWSLEGAATTSSFGSVDDERRRTAGQHKLILKPILDREKKNSSSSSSKGTMGTSRMHLAISPALTLTLILISPSKREKGRAGQSKLAAESI